MLFSGGLVPSYILITQHLKLQNNFWVYILPSLANGFQIIVIRTFFKGLPASLMESAKIDGASEFRIFAQIILPLSKPVLATIGLMVLMSKWNDWFTCLLYIRDKNLYTLQFLLQKILMDAEFLFQMSKNSGAVVTSEVIDPPTESMRFALAVIAAGPMLLVFPFFQKYFAKGLTIGAVKG
jgi:putative aldouronate transport system permease protein